jgi:DNA-directed RNA polymerase II subunit RPB11
MSNAPDRYLSWRWEDESEAERLVYKPDSKKPNAGTFIMAKEDHTIGNLMRMQLLRDPSVRYSGYRMPHPLTMEVHVRVETMDSKLTPTQVRHNLQSTWLLYIINRTCSAHQVFESALADLQLETDILEQKLDVSYLRTFPCLPLLTSLL